MPYFLVLLSFLISGASNQIQKEIDISICEKRDSKLCAEYIKSLYQKNRTKEAEEVAKKFCSEKMVDVCIAGATVSSFLYHYEECTLLLKGVCSEKEPVACAILSDCLFELGRVEESLIPAKTACEKNIYDACSTVAAYYLNKNLKGEAIIWARRGCEGGSSMSCGATSALFVSDGEFKEAFEFARKGCLLNDRNSCKAAGLCCTKLRYGCEQEYYEKCCKLKDKECCNLIKKTEIDKKKGDSDFK
ncbi:MAG: hypothetical protein ACP5QK_08005 [Myxococcota bacterium]